MKVNELRVDNWVEITSDEGNEFIQCNVNTIKLVERGSDFIIPIPLTEEWLLKFGFEWDDITWYRGLLMLAEAGRAEGYDAFIDTLTVKLPNTYMFVHDLQNLYYALTGEEL